MIDERALLTTRWARLVDRLGDRHRNPKQRARHVEMRRRSHEAGVERRRQEARLELVEWQQRTPMAGHLDGYWPSVEATSGPHRAALAPQVTQS